MAMMPMMMISMVVVGSEVITETGVERTERKEAEGHG
jgi:hypothetical protein